MSPSAREKSLLLSLNFKFKSNLKYLNYSVGGGLLSAGTFNLWLFGCRHFQQVALQSKFYNFHDSFGDFFFPDDGVLF